MTASLAGKHRALMFSIVCAFLQMPVHCGLGGPSVRCRPLLSFQRLRVSDATFLVRTDWPRTGSQPWVFLSFSLSFSLSVFFFSLSLFLSSFFFFFAAFVLLCLSCYLCRTKWRQSAWMEAKCLSYIRKIKKGVCEERGIRFSPGSPVEDDGSWLIYLLILLSRYRVRYLRLLWSLYFWCEILKRHWVK